MRITGLEVPTMGMIAEALSETVRCTYRRVRKHLVEPVAAVIDPDG